MDDKEFLELIAEVDCPEDLVKMAETKWQRHVAVEFVIMDRKINERDARFAKVEKDVHWIKWLAVSVFGVVVLGILGQYWGQIQALLGF